jgi:hypothetical protein
MGIQGVVVFLFCGRGWERQGGQARRDIFAGRGGGKKFVLESGEGVQVKDLGGDLE